jgi:SAM-dependent methyltransferase
MLGSLKNKDSKGKGSKERIKFYEIGIGKGDFVRQAANFGFMVKGNDLSRDMAGRIDGFQIDNKRFEDLNYKGSFDIVYASHVLEHSNDPGKFVKSINKSLKRGGIAVIRVPNLNSSYNRLAEVLLGEYKWVNFLPVPDHLTIFNTESLSRLFRRHGFEIAHITSMPLISNLVMSYLSVFARFLILKSTGILGTGHVNPSSFVTSKNNKPRLMRRIFNFMVVASRPIDKLWGWVTWPVFKRYNLGEELLVVARKRV